jgi:hypothetical protein
VYPFLLSSGDSGTVWFLGHDTNGSLTTTAFTGNNIKICWGSAGDTGSASPAIEVSIYYETSPNNLATVNIARIAIDSDTEPSGRSPANNFSATPDGGTCTIAGKTYAFQKTLTLSGAGKDFTPAITTAGLMLARVRMFYNASPEDFGIDVSGSGSSPTDNLPAQARTIDSNGVAGASNRRIVVYQGWPEFPFASNSVLSPSALSY